MNYFYVPSRCISFKKSPLSFTTKNVFLKDLEAIFNNVNIKICSTPISLFLWEASCLTLKGVLLHAEKLPHVIEVGKV